MKMIRRVTGREIQFDGSEAGYRTALTQEGLPTARIDAIVSGFRLLAANSNVPTDDLKRLTGQRGISLDDYIKGAAQRGVWH